MIIFHPIIWAQIIKGMADNVFKDLPFTPNEIFAFLSRYTLLNSGPYILKILQMIRPVLTDEIATKYNLTKLSYPLIEPNQVEMILQEIVINYSMLKVVLNRSASVGHVCIGYYVDNQAERFVIKIIKPLSIAQSCWEYKTLYDLYPVGSCESEFIQNMLKSNGEEMNVNNEIANLNECRKPRFIRQTINSE